MSTSTLTWANAPAPGLLQEPDDVRLGLVALPGAHPGTGDQPLFRHLAAMLAPAGVALLSFDRREPAQPGADTSIEVQAEDAHRAAAAMRDRIGAPVGFFGFSQGAWVATRAASEPEAAALVTIGFSAVTPAEQMRHFTDEALRRRGFGAAQRDELRSTRLAVEDVLRGHGTRESVEARLVAAAEQDWFVHAGIPPALPAPGATWSDMDLDPLPWISDVTCPALAVWGEDEECVPVAEGLAAWPDATTALLAHCGHWPAQGSGEPGFDHDRDDVPVDAALGVVLRDWLAAL